MIEELQTAEDLEKAGRLDKKLKVRLKIFKVLLFLFGVITAYDVLFEGFYWFHVFLVVAASFLFGFVLLFKINDVKWDGRRRRMYAQKMDIYGGIIVFLYIVLRILADIYIKGYFYGSVKDILAYTFFSTFGIMLGRYIGSIVAIHKAHKV